MLEKLVFVGALPYYTAAVRFNNFPWAHIYSLLVRRVFGQDATRCEMYQLLDKESVWDMGW